MTDPTQPQQRAALTESGNHPTDPAEQETLDRLYGPPDDAGVYGAHRPSVSGSDQ